MPAVGKAAAYMLHKVPGVVLVDVQDHGATGIALPPGHVSLVVWVEPVGGRTWRDQAPEVWREVQRGASLFHQHVVAVVREATRWARVRAWWRRKVWESAKRAEGEPRRSR